MTFIQKTGAFNVDEIDNSTIHLFSLVLAPKHYSSFVYFIWRYCCCCCCCCCRNVGHTKPAAATTITTASSSKKWNQSESILAENKRNHGFDYCLRHPQTHRETFSFTRCQFHQPFYVRIFRMNVISAAFSTYVLALAPKFCTKMRASTLMKLTAGKLDFINDFFVSFEVYKQSYNCNKIKLVLKILHRI